MAKSQKPRKGRGKNPTKAEPPKRHHRDEKRRESGEHKVFVDLIQRRLGGGATPTAQAYAKAMQQWQKLPGAVGFTALPAFPKATSEPASPLIDRKEEFENGGEPE